MARIRIEIDTGDDDHDPVIFDDTPPPPPRMPTPRSPRHPSMREAEVIPMPMGDGFDDDDEPDPIEVIPEARDEMWEEIVAAQRRFVDGLKNGDDSELTNQRRNWIGGAVAVYAKLTGQDALALGQELSEMFPIDTYQGRPIRRSHRTERPERHPGATRRVDPTPEEIDRLGTVVELSPEEAAGMDTLVVDQSEMDGHLQALRDGNPDVFTDRG